MIAIGILTYNNIESTKSCIEKIYKNTSSDFILYILDNGSSDGTVEYLSNLKYENIYIFSNKENIGIIDGRNKLYELLESYNYDYLCFLDNDQFVNKDWDATYLHLMNSYDVVGQEAWQMKQDFKPFRRIHNKSEYFNYVGCGGMMIRREVIKDIGLFDSIFNPKYFEDPDFCFRASQNEYKIGWCSDKLIEHQKHDLKLSATERVFFMRNLRIIQDRWRALPLPKFKM